MFKKKKKETADATAEQSNDTFYIKNRLTKRERITIKVKRFIYVSLVLMGLAGGIRFWLVSPPNYEYGDDIATEQSFIQDYMRLVYTKEKTTEESDRMLSYQLNDWALQFSEDVVLNSVDVYYQQRISPTITKYYMVVNLKVNETTVNHFATLDVAREDNHFLIISPLVFTSTEFKLIETKSTYRKEFIDSSMTVLTSEEIKNAKSIIELLFESYNVDLEKAKSLVADPSILITHEQSEYLLDTLTINGSYKNKSGSTYYLNVSIVENVDNTYKISRNFNIEYDVKKNQIIKLEVE